jgi:hypothetical protein
MNLRHRHPKHRGHRVSLLDAEEAGMFFQVKVRVDVTKLAAFGAQLQRGALDRSAIRGETWCLADDPAVGVSVWEAADRAAFEAVFAAWRHYYSETEVRALITPSEALGRLLS